MPSLNAVDWVVLFAGLASIAWVNWYFLLSGGRTRAAAAPTAGGMQEVVIAVHGGYEPQSVRVAAGQPVRLVFDRQETSPCSEEVVFGDFGIRRFLPAHEKTSIEITPETPGVYEFTCGMSMLRGRIIAQ